LGGEFLIGFHIFILLNLQELFNLA
jgi:hypothetical protein